MSAVENLVIAGERVPAAEGRIFDTVNPANGEVFRTVAEAGAEDADRAVRAAAAAFEDWGARTAVQRAKILYRWADLDRGARRGARAPRDARHGDGAR